MFPNRMDRISSSSEFLKTLVTSKISRRVYILKHCTEDQLKVLVECVVNLRYFKLQNSHKGLFNLIKPLRSYFSKNRTLRVERIRNIFKRHNTILKKLLSVLLLKLSQEAVACVLQK
jgi:hypothetical protein